MKLKYYSILLALIALGSCSKEIEIDKGIEDFKVKTTSLTYKVNDDVNFEFEGNANLVTFFSGETFNQYDFKEGRIVETNGLDLGFTSANPVLTGGQSNQLSVMASTDFNGDYNSFSSVQQATWTDISSRFVYGTSATFVASGTKSIADLIAAGKPLYIAYKYITRPQLISGPARSWLVQGFSITSNTSVGTLTLTDMNNAGFRIVDQNAETAPAKSSVSISRVTLNGNEFTLENDPQTENWAISKPIYTGLIDNGPDRPVSIKGTADAPLKKYTYNYSKKGVYQVYFIATNVNVYQKEDVVRKLEITITD
ncbi:DUF5017 domain-containing protein [Pedobacter nyackensis]|uniref:DUF5017 domain-containing protein n=1 Tax=Pedobacter nyackensis TaxID=475255 RepID=A0A1W2EX47_9SPHI|nr:DUF5017 domain-containing protein [Pedobacter nyackensis]SMD14283.1 protein of unknown function [Pedobacter nyackensis]